MILRQIDTNDLDRYGMVSRTPYVSHGFVDLNKAKAEGVEYYGLFNSKDKLRLAVCFGRYGQAGDNPMWRSPFSAPFGEFLYTKPQSLQTCVDFVKLLRENLSGDIMFRMAPDFYDPLMLPKFKGALAAVAKYMYQDYNYHYPIEMYCDYISGLNRNAHKNYKRSLGVGFETAYGVALARAYDVIARNRSEHGYPLAMSLNDLSATAMLVDIDTFVLSLGSTDVAAAIVYRVTTEIAQVIYWGDVAGYSGERPMNLLAERVFNYYRKLGFKIVDIGPSSSAGVPDLGLCTFKESLGCILTSKPTYIL